MHGQGEGSISGQGFGLHEAGSAPGGRPHEDESDPGGPHVFGSDPGIGPHPLFEAQLLSQLPPPPRVKTSDVTVIVGG